MDGRYFLFSFFFILKTLWVLDSSNINIDLEDYNPYDETTSSSMNENNTHTNELNEESNSNIMTIEEDECSSKEVPVGEIGEFLSDSKKEVEENNENIKNILDDMLEENPKILSSYEEEGIEGLWNFLNKSSNGESKNESSEFFDLSSVQSTCQNIDDTLLQYDYVSILDISKMEEINKNFHRIIENIFTEHETFPPYPTDIRKIIFRIIENILDENNIPSTSINPFEKNSSLNKIKRFTDQLIESDSSSLTFFTYITDGTLDILDTTHFMKFYVSMLYLVSDKRLAGDKSDLILKVRSRKKKIDEFFSTEKKTDLALLGQILCSKIFEFSQPKRSLQVLLEILPFLFFTDIKSDQVSKDIEELQVIMDNIKLMLKKMHSTLGTIMNKLKVPLKKRRCPHRLILTEIVNRDITCTLKNIESYIDDSMSFVKNAIEKKCQNELNLVHILYHDLGWLGLSRFQNIRFSKVDDKFGKDLPIVKFHLQHFENLFCFLNKSPFSKYVSYLLSNKKEKKILHITESRETRDQIILLSMFYPYMKIMKGIVLCIKQYFKDLLEAVKAFLRTKDGIRNVSDDIIYIVERFKQTLEYISLGIETTHFIEVNRNSITMIGMVYTMGYKLNKKNKEMNAFIEAGPFNINKNNEEFIKALYATIEELKSGYTKLFNYMETEILMSNLEK